MTHLPRTPRLLATALAAAVLVTVVTVGPLAGTSQAGQPVWTPIWVDDFDGHAGAPLDPAKWIYDTGHGYPDGPNGWGNDELQSYTSEPANVALTGSSQLRITATRDAAGAWRSGRIETVRSDFSPPAGGSLRIETRLQLPGGGAGIWPAFWALGRTLRTKEQPWPRAGEIDIMENINNSPTIRGTLHCGVIDGGPCHETVGRSSLTDLPATVGSGFHIYSIVWNSAARTVSWFLDGRRFGQVDHAMIGDQAWSETFGHGYFVLLNVAVGGTLPGPPSSTTQPSTSMIVDWVHIATSTG